MSGNTSSQENIQSITTILTLANHLDHFLARLSINRMGHLVKPGIYKLGNPTRESNVFVTANYTLSFDALRSSLSEIDCFILALDTKGVNVWCAAGKGTFGTDELVHQIEITKLENIIDHRTLILPQLGAPGVSAHKVKELTGFSVKYGPVRAVDIPQYLRNKKATSQMRLVNFSLKDRLVLVPVEFVHILLPILILGIILFFTVGLLPGLASISAILAATVLFPILLPWLPTHNFGSKGFILGGIVAISFGSINLLGNSDSFWLFRLMSTLAYLLILPPITAFLSLNFTGSTTFTSKTGVRNEIYTYFPVMVWMFGSGIVFFITSIIYSLIGGP